VTRPPRRRRGDPDTTDAVRATVRSVVGTFEVDVTALSTMLARRQGLDTISVKHVVDAGGFLSTRPVPLKIRLIGTVGGCLFGAAISNAASLLAAPAPSRSGIVVTLTFGIVGGAAAAVGALRNP
jgi:hypothetical protein